MPVNMMERMAAMRGKPPEEALFFWSGGPVEVAEKVWFQSLFSGVTAFETDEGIVLVDSGLFALAPQLAAMLREKTKAPIHTAIFTQGHVDHAFGLKAFLAPGQARPRIIAHKAMPQRFARYALTAQHNAALNARQFGGTVKSAEADPQTYASFMRPPELAPDLLYEERLDIKVGGLSFEIHHCMGETDDHSWIFCPERKVLCPGDLFIWGAPNAGNPQKVQRYAASWAVGLRAMAAKEAASLAPGHGGPCVQNPAQIKQMLSETAGFLEVIHRRTVAALNHGSPPHIDVLHEVELPPATSPWLTAVYDDPEFIIRNIIRLYGGWWNGRPSELKPAKREALAKQIARLAGGAQKLAEKAQGLMKEDPRTACHLADFALEAAPDNQQVQQQVAAIYLERAKAERSLMAVNIFESAAAYAKEGRPFR